MGPKSFRIQKACKKIVGAVGDAEKINNDYKTFCKKMPFDNFLLKSTKFLVCF